MSDFAIARRKMIDGQVRPGDVTDLRLLDAMFDVPREAFVPERLRAMAYLDLDLNIAESGRPKRCLLKPGVLAKMLQAAEIAPTDRVLIVGCATGYTAAVASRLASEIRATDSDDALTANATTTLTALGYDNVQVKTAPANEGDLTDSPFDVIVIDGATAVVPDQLYHQLRIGGRLVGVFATTQPSRAMLVTRSAGDYGSRILFDASATALPGLERLPAFVF